MIEAEKETFLEKSIDCNKHEIHEAVYSLQ